MKIVQIVDSMYRADGGITHSTKSLSTELIKLGLDVFLYTQHTNDKHADLDLPINLCNHVITAKKIPFTSGHYSRKLYHQLSELLMNDSSACVLHEQGIWLPANYYSYVLGKKYSVPRIISLRGSLLPWRMNYRQLKKTIIWRLFQKNAVSYANVLHATSEIEYESIRSMGLNNPVAVIPNGVYKPDLVEVADSRRPAHPRKKVALFLSRIHPVKGLEDLIRAWGMSDTRDWELRIVGPDEGGYSHVLKEMCRNCCINNNVSIVGPVYGEEKSLQFQEADLFILPSHSENFGLVIGEALAHSVPCLTTNKTPWESISSYKAGWVIDDNVEALTYALSHILKMEVETLKMIGNRGPFIIENFKWSEIAKSFQEIYKWMIDPVSNVVPNGVRME